MLFLSTISRPTNYVILVRYLRHFTNENRFERIFSGTHMFGKPAKSFSAYNLTEKGCVDQM